jgi:hypothetical protein
MPASAFEDGDPFCTQCGFLLRGHESAPRCPECDAPLPAALDRYDARTAQQPSRTVRRESSARLFGWPLVSIALGPDRQRGERVGKARGIIAIGDVAIGGVAIGGGAVGIVAIGGGAVGVAAVGGGSVGLISLGGGALGGFAAGGISVGGIATGGVALGYIAQGATAAGVYARGAVARGAHTIDPARADPDAQQLFDTLAPILGTAAPGAASPAAVLPTFIVPLVSMGLLAAVIGAIVVLAQRRHDTQRRRRSDMFDDIVPVTPDGRSPRRSGR